MTSKRTVIAIVAAVAAFGAVSASAAGLGGLTGKSLGADTNVVASCDTNGITVDYATTYTLTSAQYTVSSVTLGGVDSSCGSKSVKITLADSAGASLGEATGVATNAASQTFNVTTGTPAAKSVINVAVVISG
jgi:hypothetical protein